MVVAMDGDENEDNSMERLISSVATAKHSGIKNSNAERNRKMSRSMPTLLIL